MPEILELSLETAEHLRHNLRNLASLMARSAESLRQGEPADLDLLAEEIAQVREQVRVVEGHLEDHPLLAEYERSIRSTEDIVQVCQEIARRQEALDLLHQLQLVKSFDPADREALQGLNVKIEELLVQLTTGASEQRQHVVQTVTAEESPWRTLYVLVSQPQELSDDRWLNAQLQLTETFGPGIAVAILRGRAR